MIQSSNSLPPHSLTSGDIMSDDVRWSWYNKNTNNMHSKCNALDSSPNYSSPPCPQRNDLPWNQSLAPKRLETAGVKDRTQSSLRRLTFLELCGPLSQGLYALTSVWYLHCLFSLPGMLFSTSPHGVFPHFRCHLFNSGFPCQIILKSNLLHGPSIRPSLPTIKFILSKISPVSLNWNESKYFFFLNVHRYSMNDNAQFQ